MSVKPLYEFDDEQRRFIINMHLQMRYRGIVTGPVEGAYGEVYFIEMPDGTFPKHLAVKCPKFKKFGCPERAREGLEKVLYEIEKTHKLHMIPWVSRFFEIQLIHGWPFLWSRFRHGTLEDLIGNPLAWSLQDKVCSLIQISRALFMAREKGMASHQDLKPANIFFEDWTRRGVPKSSCGMHYQMLVADFGLADAFRDLGKNNGSRPYMAPEQFKSQDVEIETSEFFDIYALGVIAHECFFDGLHPMGVITNDVWPWRAGLPRRWDREAVWRDWSRLQNKTLPRSEGIPGSIQRLILRCLSSDIKDRPNIAEYEVALWAYLQDINPDTAAGLRMQIDNIEGLSSGESEWPYMDDRIKALRRFYSEI